MTEQDYLPLSEQLLREVAAGYRPQQWICQWLARELQDRRAGRIPQFPIEQEGRVSDAWLIESLDCIPVGSESLRDWLARKELLERREAAREEMQRVCEACYYNNADTCPHPRSGCSEWEAANA